MTQVPTSAIELSERAAQVASQWLNSGMGSAARNEALGRCLRSGALSALVTSVLPEGTRTDWINELVAMARTRNGGGR